MDALAVAHIKINQARAELAQLMGNCRADQVGLLDQLSDLLGEAQYQIGQASVARMVTRMDSDDMLHTREHDDDCDD